MELKNNDGNKTAQPLNRLPRMTWRWLNVNEYNLKNFAFPEITKYGREFIKSSNHGSIIVEKMHKKLRALNFIRPYFDTQESQELSESLTEFVSLNFNAGVVIHAPENEKTAVPVHVKYETSEEDAAIIENSLIVAEKGSQVNVIVENASLDDFSGIHSGITKIYAKEGSTVNLVKVQTMNNNSINLDSIVIYAGYGAKVNCISVEFGSSKTITDYTANLDEDNAEVSLKSIYFGDGIRQIDLNYIMNHRGRRSRSSIEAFGALKDKSRKLFKGTIDFKSGCTKAKGTEEEFVTLLDPSVKAEAVPLLLCEEDDVEGQHAASAGKINGDKLFYLMSRGFSERDSKRLIVEASFRPVIDLIPNDEIKEQLLKELERRLNHED